MATPNGGTPTQQLVEHKLGQSLSEYVLSKRNAKPQWSWQLIADQIAEDTSGEISLSREALRKWYGDEAAA